MTDEGNETHGSTMEKQRSRGINTASNRSMQSSGNMESPRDGGGLGDKVHPNAEVRRRLSRGSLGLRSISGWTSAYHPSNALG